MAAKPTKLTRPSKPVFLKVDEARTINKAIDKKIAEKRKEADYYYKESRAIRPKSNEKLKSREASERKYLSNSYYRRSEEARQYANKLEWQYRATNKKDFSKSLWAVAKMWATKSIKKWGKF